MKESRLFKDKARLDEHIEQYCRSVEALLKRVDEKARKITRTSVPEEELHWIDDTEELIEY